MIFEKGLKKYLVENRVGLLTLDFDKLKEVSDEKFKKIHREENNIFIRNHVKQTGHFPECEYCEEFITKSEELIREPGGSSHVWCFESVYEGELINKFTEKERGYYSRMIRILSDFS